MMGLMAVMDYIMEIYLVIHMEKMVGYARADTGFCIGTSCITSWPTGDGDGISGSGTSNYVSKWTGTSFQGDSIIYDNGVNVGVSTNVPSQKLHVNGYVRGTGFCIGTSCITSWPSGGGEDIYWSGTATNLDPALGRSSLGLGSLATLSAVSGGTGGTITDGTITNADISSSAAIAASKIQYGTYFITSAGTSGQVWTSDGSGAGIWSTPSGGESLPSGSANYTLRHNGTTWVSSSLLYNNGTNIGIGIISPTYKLHVQGTAFSSGWYTSSDGRYKTNVLEIDDALRGISFVWDRANFPDYDFPEKREYGFIAQEVEKEFPNLVNTDETGYKSVMYDRFSALLLEAIKEQQVEIEVLHRKITDLELRLSD